MLPMSTAPGRFLATCRPAAIVFAMAGDLTRNASGVPRVMRGIGAVGLRHSGTTGKIPLHTDPKSVA